MVWGEKELAGVQKVLSGLFLTTGPETIAFEKEFAEFLGVSHAIGVSSCTMALVLALKALGVGQGDEVVTTPMTYVATANAILHAGATPVFVDVEPDTGNLDVSEIEAVLNEKTRAILPVHLYGAMCDMQALRELAQRKNLHVIEDGAHCVEGTRDGLQPGQAGDAACFSFYATKNLSSGEGGMVVTNHSETAERLRRLRNQGVDRDAATRYKKTIGGWDQTELGYKANLSDIQAAMLRPQLARIGEIREKRQTLARRYDEAFSDVPGVEPMKVPEGATSARHLYTIRTAPKLRDATMEYLKENGVGTAINYRAIHQLTYLRKRLGYRDGSFPIAEKIGDSTISLPFYTSLSFDEQDYVIALLRERFGKDATQDE